MAISGCMNLRFVSSDRFYSVVSLTAILFTKATLASNFLGEVQGDRKLYYSVWVDQGRRNLTAS